MATHSAWSSVGKVPVRCRVTAAWTWRGTTKKLALAVSALWKRGVLWGESPWKLP